MQQIVNRIQTSRPYDVVIGPGLLDGLGGLAAKVLPRCKTAVITDSNVAPLYLRRALESLKGAGFSCASLAFEAGEKSKTMTTLSQILEFMAVSSLTRSDAVIALGGGVTGDMAGFAAGIYQRGIPFIQVPTTLLADVDSSVGGKTAVDLKAGKNLAGLFWQPDLVVCDTDTLKTLPREIFNDGMAEAIKYGVLTDPELFEEFAQGRAESSLPSIISRCVEIKARYVACDEHDRGVRTFLNLGHTMGHAIEKLSRYTCLHGHAVAIGMVMAARAGEKLGITRPGTAATLVGALERCGLPTKSPYSPQELASAALADKKRSGGEITFIFIEDIGRCILKKVPVDKLLEIAILGKE